MPSLVKGRPVHHYAGHDDDMLHLMGLSDGDIEEVRRRLSDPQYDREKASEERDPSAPVASMFRDPAREWADDPRAPDLGAPSQVRTFANGGAMSLRDLLDEHEIAGVADRRREQVEELKQADEQLKAERAAVGERVARDMVADAEAQLGVEKRRVERVKERAERVEKEYKDDEPALSPSVPVAPVEPASRPLGGVAVPEEPAPFPVERKTKKSD